MAERFQELLYLIALAALVLRARVFDYGQLQLMGEIRYALLARVYQRAYLRHAGAVEVGHGLEAAQPPLEQQRHHECFDRVVKMMPQSELVHPALAQKIAERAAAHFRAERAGVVLLPHIEHDLLDVGFDAGVRYVDPRAELGHGGEIHAVEAQLYRHGFKLKLSGVVSAQPVEREQEHKTVFPAGHADGHAVAVLYHAVVVHGAADQTGEIIECFVHKKFP